MGDRSVVPPSWSESRSATTYQLTIVEENRVVPGMLFLAIVDNPNEIKANHHEKISWVEEDEILNLEQSECVNNFHDSAKKAFVKYNQMVLLEDNQKVTAYDIYYYLKSNEKPNDLFTIGGEFHESLNEYLFKNQKPPVSIEKFRSFMSELERMGIVNDEDTGGAQYWRLMK